jgi:hypothetical protein
MDPNRVRKHQYALFMSNILGAGGESLDKHYLQKQQGTDCWSTMKFPREVVTEVEMHLWRMAVTQVVAAGQARNRLGTFIEEGHKIWSGGFAKTLVDYTGKMMTLLRSGNMFDKEDMVHPNRVIPGK